ncbi:MAG: Uma2 family endonuclease [Leptolyngbyaceae cyanobacterium SL_5_9]|nr:Uma2 family endonuclease [Leptolyngbyaceae cyanobacterium SL_5_9]NJO73027.1 Uma2 family endonuclease [Leptolyngbyaceae cyanobacterium RM1_406_9]
MTSALEKPRASEDKVAVYYDRTWEQFKWIQKGLEGHPGVRLSFYEGIVEVFMPGQPHEIFKKVVAALLEAFFFEWNIRIIPTGSVTQEQEGVASVQADESYCFGEAKPIPDLSVEVIFTSDSATKLERYRALSVPEVWLWEDGLLTLHRLGENGYTRIDRSQIPELANLDIELFSRCVLIGETDWLEAMRTFRNAISKG